MMTTLKSPLKDANITMCFGGIIPKIQIFFLKLCDFSKIYNCDVLKSKSDRISEDRCPFTFHRVLRLELAKNNRKSRFCLQNVLVLVLKVKI